MGFIRFVLGSVLCLLVVLLRLLFWLFAFLTGIMQILLVFNFHHCTRQSLLDGYKSFSEDFLYFSCILYADLNN